MLCCAVQLPPGGFWELQYRQTHGRGDEHAWRPYAERLTDTTVTVERLVPGTSYDFRARGGFEGMGDISMGGFSVTATVSTTGRKPAATAASAAAAAASAAVPAKSVGKGGAKAARSAGEAVRPCTEQVRREHACCASCTPHAVRSCTEQDGCTPSPSVSVSPI